MKTWGGLGKTVRLSCYGDCCRNYINWVKSFYGKHTYILGFHDCPNFAREVVEDLTDKTVGVWPIEDGPSFGRRNIDDLEKISKDAGGFWVGMAAINPFYWAARLFEIKTNLNWKKNFSIKLLKEIIQWFYNLN